MPPQLVLKLNYSDVTD